MLEKLFLNIRRRLTRDINKYKSCEQNDSDLVDGMFPRVLRCRSKCINIELTLFADNATCINPEHLLTVADRFIQATNPSVEGSKRYNVR